MNFDMGAEKADEEDDIRVETVLVTDDVVSSDNIPDRRGIAGDFFVFKVAGAKAATGADLDEVVAEDRKDYFTELDSAIGDGDHGMNLSIGFREVNKNIEEWKELSVKDLYKNVGTALLDKVGGSSGPLYGSFFMKFGLPIKKKGPDEGATYSGSKIRWILDHVEGAQERAEKGLLTVAWGKDGKVKYSMGASILIAGQVVQWLRDKIHLVDTAAQTEEVAESIPDNGGLFFVPAFTGLGAPHWNTGARGMMIVITAATTREQMVRAALESMAYQTRDLLEEMERNSGIKLRRSENVKMRGSEAS